jgi:hypothetical protein
MLGPWLRGLGGAEAIGRGGHGGQFGPELRRVCNSRACGLIGGGIGDAQFNSAQFGSNSAETRPIGNAFRPQFGPLETGPYTRENYTRTHTHPVGPQCARMASNTHTGGPCGQMGFGRRRLCPVQDGSGGPCGQMGFGRRRLCPVQDGSGGPCGQMGFGRRQLCPVQDGSGGPCGQLGFGGFGAYDFGCRLWNTLRFIR